MARPFLRPVSIVGSRYCSPNSVEIAIVRDVTNGNLAIKDVHGNVLVKVVETISVSSITKKIILDAAGNPVITLLPGSSRRSRWQAFKGESTDTKDLILKAKKHSKFSSKLDVFLANTTAEKTSDFTANGKFSKQSCVIYGGDKQYSNNIVAQMKEKQKSKSNASLGEKDQFMVTVNPNIDYAFIAALMVILHDMNPPKNRSCCDCLALPICQSVAEAVLYGCILFPT